MAFTSAVTQRTVFGNKRVNYGTFSQISGDTGGVIDTGLSAVDFFMTTAENVSIAASGGAVTVVMKDPVAAQNGFWEARGR